jgi:hypothetical protein
MQNMKKKVGIITMHKVFNYGSALQAYALQRTIEKLGFDVELIDYEYPNNYHKSWHKKGMSKMDKTVYVARNIFVKTIRLLMGISIKRHMKRFSLFYRTFFKLSERHYSSKEEIHENPPKYDIYVTGSDQVWNPKYTGNDTTFMLSFAKDPALKIAYSACFATDRIDDSLKKTYADSLNKYKYLSTREKAGCDLLEELINRESEVVLDPTLLLTKDEWSEVAETSDLKIDKPYILVYIMHYAYDPYPYVIDFIKHVQKQMGLSIVILGLLKGTMLFYHNAINLPVAGPNDFVKLFKNASFVITTSFHGTAFALNFEKPFYALVDKQSTGDNRINNLLELTGASDRGVKIMSDYPTNFAMDYDEVSHNLKSIREKSVNYLKSALQ